MCGVVQSRCPLSLIHDIRQKTFARSGEAQVPKSKITTVDLRLILSITHSGQRQSGSLHI